MSGDHEDLLAVQGLEASDLERNRAGAISEAQAAYTRTWVRRTRLVMTIAICIGGGAAVIAGIVAGQLIPAIGGAVGAGLFALVMYLVTGRFIFGPLLAQVEAGQVLAVEGTIARRMVSWNNRGYSIWVGGRRYGSARTTVGKALQQGERVRLFVLPARVIVGVERI